MDCNEIIESSKQQMASSKLYWERKSGEEETSERYELWLRKLGFDNNKERGVFDSTQKGLVFSREIPKTKKKWSYYRRVPYWELKREKIKHEWPNRKRRLEGRRRIEEGREFNYLNWGKRERVCSVCVCLMFPQRRNSQRKIG